MRLPATTKSCVVIYISIITGASLQCSYHNHAVIRKIQNTNAVYPMLQDFSPRSMLLDMQGPDAWVLHSSTLSPSSLAYGCSLATSGPGHVVDINLSPRMMIHHKGMALTPRWSNAILWNLRTSRGKSGPTGGFGMFLHSQISRHQSARFACVLLGPCRTPFTFLAVTVSAGSKFPFTEQVQNAPHPL